MTTQAPVPSARDVAKALDRRRMRRRLVFWLVLLGAAIAFVLYARCGNGFGLGTGSGAGAGTGSAAVAPPEAPPMTACLVRVSATGITVDGIAKPADKVVEACAAHLQITVLVTGDAKQGEWEQLQHALDAANKHYKLDKPR